ncbi:MAG TPA: DHA2 family efflux MFS transporter permease subunit, partial [Trueperaceae bacterium]
GHPRGAMNSMSLRDRNYTLIGILLALFLGALDQTIVATALPKITEDLQGLSRYAWVVTAYLLASTVLVPIYGKLADIYSRKRIELVAVSVFLAGSFLCGLSGEFGRLPLLGDGMNQLIIFRALQGLGGAGLSGMAFIIIADLFPPSERGRYQGLTGAVFGVASVLGPVVGGFLTDYGGNIIPGIAGWRWVFYVNLPFGALALWFIIGRMPPLRPAGGGSLNYISAALLLIGLVPLVLALQLDKQTYGWGDPLTLTLFGIFVIAMTLFSFRSLHVKNPILDFSLFRNKVFTTSNIALFLLGAGFFSIVIFLPLFMVNVVGVSATSSGLSLIPLSLGVVLGSTIAGQLVSRFGHYRLIMLTGGVILFVGVVFLSQMTLNVRYWQVTAYMVICGLGLGPSFPLYTLAIQNAVDVRKMGQATSASQFFRQIGGTVGAAVMGTVMASSLVASFANLQLPGGGQFSGAQSQLTSTGGADIGAKIHEAFDQQYALLERAYRQNDAQAMQQLLQNPQLPEAFKAQLRAGTPRQQVEARFQDLYQALAAATRNGRPEAARKALAQSGLPSEVRTGIMQGVTASQDKPQVQQAFLAQLQSQLRAQADQVARQATEQTLAQIKSQFDQQADQVAAEVTHALKVAFTDAITRIYFLALFVIAAGWFVTWFVPELPLRKTLDTSAMAAAD